MSMIALSVLATRHNVSRGTILGACLGYRQKDGTKGEPQIKVRLEKREKRWYVDEGEFEREAQDWLRSFTPRKNLPYRASRSTAARVTGPVDLTEYWTVEQAARIAKCGKGAIKSAGKSGVIRTVLVHAHLLMYHRGDVNKWIESRNSLAPSSPNPTRGVHTLSGVRELLREVIREEVAVGTFDSAVERTLRRVLPELWKAL